MALLWWFAETSIVAAILALLASLAGRIRSIGPAARHALWLVVLVKLMTPPLLQSPISWTRPGSMIPEGPERIVAALPTSPEPTAPEPTPSEPDPTPAPRISPAIVRTVSEAPPMAAVPTPIRTSFAIPAPTKTSTPDPDPAPVSAAPESSWALTLPSAELLGYIALGVWIVGTIAIAAVQATRVIRFRRRLRYAVPAPEFLVDEAEQIGEHLNVRVPEILVVPELGTPLLWCLGRPKLLLPTRLVKSLELDAWRGILTHELAHVRRGDPWVSRLELLAGLVWWWNPLYWVARRRLDAEAELACDAWTVWAFPEDRFTYAEVLFHVCASVSLAKSPEPALGVAGAGRFFQRRLTMILREHVPCRLSPAGFLGACLLLVLAVPSWTTAGPAEDGESEETRAAAKVGAPDVDVKVAVNLEELSESLEAELEKAGEALEAKLEKAGEELEEKLEAEAEKLEADIEKLEADDEDDDANGPELEAKMNALTKEIDAIGKKMDALGKEMIKSSTPELEAKMKALGEKMEAKSKELETKVAPKLEAKMKALGEKMEARGKQLEKEMNAKFGPDSKFAKEMKELGERMEKQFGPGSDFEKKMRSEFGPDSKFVKEMKAMGEEMAKQFGPGSDFEAKVKKQQAENLAAKIQKEKAEAARSKAKAELDERVKKERDEASKARAQANKARAEANKARVEANKAKVKAKLKEEARRREASGDRSRTDRIKVLEDQIQNLMGELKKLKAEEKEDRKDDSDDDSKGNEA